MNIVRYNIGGGGQNDVIDTHHENIPANFPWFKDINGFWINWFSDAPNSSSYQWERDANQRQILALAQQRGVNTIEFFSNAPMWWMMDSKSSAGGKLQSWNRRDFAKYLATTVKYAQENWGVRVHSISPFNEPSANWWTYPKEQEGCNIPKEEQKEILGYLREELDNRNLQSVLIAASDENSMNSAKSTFDYLKGQNVNVNGKVKIWRV